MLWELYLIRERRPPLAIPINCDPHKQILVWRESTHGANATGGIPEGRLVEVLEEHVVQRGRPISKSQVLDVIWNSFENLVDYEEYDILNPFIAQGRHGTTSFFRPHPEFKQVLIFDLILETMTIISKRRITQAPLGILTTRPFESKDFIGKPFLSPKFLDSTLLSNSKLWFPKFEVDERIYSLTKRIYTDFNYRWAFILAGDYNTITLRVMANAILKFATNTFIVKEYPESKDLPLPKPYNRDFYGVWLPKWPALDHLEFMLGDVYYIICLDIHHGQKLAQERMKDSKLEFSSNRPAFLILTIRYIVIARVSTSRTLEFTLPKRFLTGEQRDLSDVAIRYLLWATETARHYIPTKLLDLPLEIQNNILDQVSQGSIMGAQLGCLLGLGSPFLWKCREKRLNFQWLDTSNIEKCPFQSQLLISDQRCALVYQNCPEILRPDEY